MTRIILNGSNKMPINYVLLILRGFEKFTNCFIRKFFSKAKCFIIKSGNRNNPYIEEWGSLYNTWTPTFRYTGYFCYLTLDNVLGLDRTSYELNSSIVAQMCHLLVFGDIQ